MVYAWALLNQRDGTCLISREISPKSLSMDERALFWNLSSLLNKEENYSPKILRMELPSGADVFYKDLSPEEDSPYCLFVKAPPSYDMDELKKTFDSCSEVIKEFPYPEGHDLSEDDLVNLSGSIDYGFNCIPTKICLVGYAGVGKTTTACLLRKTPLPLAHNPTIGVEIKPLYLSKEGDREYNVSLWDTAGQTRFRFLLPKFAASSSLIVMVTDSTLENTLKSRVMLRSIKEYEPKAKIVGIANKEDLPKALSAGRVESTLGVPTIGFSAIDYDKRQKLVDFLVDNLETE